MERGDLWVSRLERPMNGPVHNSASSIGSMASHLTVGIRSAHCRLRDLIGDGHYDAVCGPGPQVI